MSVELGIMTIYRLLALFIAAMMLMVLWRERDWKPQFFSVLVLVPFLMRALDIK